MWNRVGMRCQEVGPNPDVGVLLPSGHYVIHAVPMNHACSSLSPPKGHSPTILKRHFFFFTFDLFGKFCQGQISSSLGLLL